MTDYADLRRLLQEDDDFFVTLERKAILALLDEKDAWDWQRDVISERDAAERRVAALEEGLRFIQGDGCLASIWASDDPLVWERCLDEDYREEPLTGNPHVDRCEACEARALLAAAPSEPLRLGQQVAIRSHLPADLDAQADAIERPAAPSEPQVCEYHDLLQAGGDCSCGPAALPAEVGE